MKRPDGVTFIGIYYILLALVFLIGACALMFSLFTVLASVYDPIGLMWSAFGIGIGLLFILAFLIGSIAAAWGMFTMKNWGRWSALILAGLQLPLFPIGTVLGGLILYYLLRSDVVAAFNGEPTTTVTCPDVEVETEDSDSQAYSSE